MAHAPIDCPGSLLPVAHPLPGFGQSPVIPGPKQEPSRSCSRGTIRAWPPSPLDCLGALLRQSTSASSARLLEQRR